MPPQTQPQPTAQETMLPKARLMMSETWSFFKSNALLLLSISGLFAALDLTVQILFGGIAVGLPYVNTVAALSAGLFFLMFVLAIVGVFVSLWAQNATFVAVAGASAGMSVKEAIKAGFYRMPALIWILLLYVCLVVGGLALFIIPGVYLLVACSFAPLLLFTENERGLSALIKSRDYVRDRFWPVAVKNFYFGVMVFVPVFVVGMVVAGVPFWILLSMAPAQLWVADLIGQLYGYFLTVFIVPFGAVFFYILYRHLKETRILPAGPNPNRKWFIALALLGVLVAALVLLVAGVGTALVYALK